LTVRNFEMLDRTRRNDCQDEHVKAAKAHKLAMALHAAASAMGALEAMSHDAEYRDMMVDEAGSVSEIALAASLVWSRVRARSAAR
jgi:hypothetical protein